MYLISAEGYKDSRTRIHILIIKQTGEIWASMKDVHAELGLKNMSDPVLKQIYGIYKTKNPTKGQTKKCKMTEREVFEKYDNLSEGEINTKNNKKNPVRNDIMTTIIKRSRGEKIESKKNTCPQRKTNDSRI